MKRIPDLHVMAGLVRQEYGAEPVALEPLGNDPTGERATYRVTLSDGRMLMLRGYRAGSHVPFWLGGGSADAWLRERALVLAWLAQQDHPAPRVVRARSGDLLAAYDGYCALAFTFLPGRPLPRTAHHMERLASALGQLHARPVWPDAGADFPASWWHPLDRAIRPLLDRLGEGAAGVPVRWQPLHAAVGEALGALHGRDDLPLAAIHGDCYPPNAIETEEGQIVLIDWDCAGRGTAVLDLCALLLDAHPDPAPGEPIVVNPQVVAAMVAGYRHHHEPTALECTSLLAATRFGVAFVAALRFIWAHEQGWSERIERSLIRLQARYAAAEDVARLASEALSDHP